MSKSTWRLSKLQKYEKSNLWQLDVLYNWTSNKSFNFYDMLSFFVIFYFFPSAQSLFWLCDPLHNQQYFHMSIIVTPNLEFIFFSFFCIPFKEGLHFTYSPNIPLTSTPCIRDYDLSPFIVTNMSSKSWNCPSSPSTISFQMHCRHYQALFV